MHYCETCAATHGWPYHWFLANEQADCVVCGYNKLCVNYDPMALPMPKEPLKEAGEPNPDVMPLTFPDEPSRRQWIIDHADYFTLIRRQKRKYEREEFSTLEAAEERGHNLVELNSDHIYMVYAVHGVHDTWVKNIKNQKKP